MIILKDSVEDIKVPGIICKTQVRLWHTQFWETLLPTFLLCYSGFQHATHATLWPLHEVFMQRQHISMIFNPRMLKGVQNNLKKTVSMPRILIAAPWCPHFIYSIITQWYNCKRKYWNIYFPCVSFLLCELLKWAALWNSQSEQSSTLSCTVKQPIRAELNIIIHDPSK